MTLPKSRPPVYKNVLASCLTAVPVSVQLFKTFYGDLIHQAAKGNAVWGIFLSCTPIKRIKKVPMTDHKYSFMVSAVLSFWAIHLSSKGYNFYENLYAIFMLPKFRKPVR